MMRSAPPPSSTRRSGFRPPPPPPPAPRSVRRRPGAAVGLWAIRLFILPHTCVGVGLIAAMVFMPFWVLAGTDTTTTVTRVWTTRSKNTTSYRIEYTDPADGRSTREDTVTGQEYERLSRLLKTPGAVDAVEADPTLPPAAALKVRSLRIGPYTHRGVIEPGASGWGTVGVVWLIGLFWNGIVSIFFYLIYVAPMREKRLHRNGDATLGRITGKTTRRGQKGGTRYVLKYTFTPPRRGISERSRRDDGESSSEYVVERAQWDAAAEGDEVWVLHWPDRAKPNVLYGYGSYCAG
jgi:hypothetical protein